MVWIGKALEREGNHLDRVHVHSLAHVALQPEYNLLRGLSLNHTQ